MATSGTAPTPPTAHQGGIPDWFARGRTNREAQSAAQAIRKVDENSSHRGDSWLRRAWHSFLAVMLASYGISAILHLLLLGAFSLIVWHSQGGSSFSTLLGVSDAEGEELLDPQSFEISAGSDGAEEMAPVIQTVPIDMPQPLAPAIDSAPVELPGIADGAGEDEKDQAGSGSDSHFAMPRGGAVVREGSFAAWTVPADPRVGQNYAIIVEVTLPEGTENYGRADLSGRLIGSDGYKIRIPNGLEFDGLTWHRPMRLPQFHRAQDVARIVFFVRGSNQALVHDTIQIHSRILDESQELEITF